MMLAYVPEHIRRDNKIWVKKGYYEVVRRFDETRWIIELADPRQAGVRTITLIQGADMLLTSEKGRTI